MLAVFDGLEHQFLGHAITTDQFDNDIDRRIGDHGKGIIGQATVTTRDFFSQFQILVSDHNDVDWPSGTPGDFLGIALEYRKGTATDGTNSQKSYIDCFHFSSFLKQNEETCIPSRK